MAVFRIERTRDYTVMSNHHLRNANLSLKAKGLLSMMLSLPEDWNYTTRGLAKGRFSFRLTAPYNEQRRRAASEAAKANASNLTRSVV